MVVKDPVVFGVLAFPHCRDWSFFLFGMSFRSLKLPKDATNYV